MSRKTALSARETIVSYWDFRMSVDGDFTVKSNDHRMSHADTTNFISVQASPLSGA